jgi:hypothetical protein
VFFKKLFGKKNDGFFLQLEDEDATSKPEAKAKAKAKESAQPVATPVAVQAAVAAPAVIVTPEAAAVAPSAVVTTAAPATGTAAPLDKKAAKAEEKAAEKAAKAAKRAAGKTEAPKVVTAPAPVAAPVPAGPAITNFATDYLIKPSSISGRRMPGANMKGFLDLARQVEKPKAFKAVASERKAEK